MKLDEALAIDPDLEYDDWEEDYQSPHGYWLEDDLDNGTVMSITIFIKEALDEELFENIIGNNIAVNQYELTLSYVEEAMKA